MSQCGGGKFLRRSIVLSLTLATAMSGCRSAPAPRPRPEADRASVIYVVKRSWHIDIGFAAADLRPPLRSALAPFPTASYLEFGFGDRHYLMAPHHGPASLLRALWPGAALILMTALKATPPEAFGADNVIRLPVSGAQLLSIQSFIWNAMSATDAGVEPVADGPYPGSVFYAAHANYSALHTCNTWAAEALQSAQLPVNSTGVEFSGQVWRQVQRIGRLRE